MKCIFGEIVNEEMKLNDYGKIVSECLKKIPMIHNNLELDYHVIMPNHIHAIIIVGDAKFASPTLSKIKVVTENDALTDRTKMVLSKIIQQFKRKCTLEIRNMVSKISNGSVHFMIELLGMKKNYSISENI